MDTSYNLIYYLIDFLIFCLVFLIFIRIYSKWVNSKIKKEKSLSKKEVDKLLKEKFSRKEKFYYYSLILIPLIIMIGSVFLGFICLRNVQLSLFYNEALLFLPTTLSNVIFSIFSLLLGIGLGLFLFRYVIHLFPRLEKLMAQKQITNTGIIEKRSYLSDINFLATYLAVLVLISAPFLFLAIDNYVYANKEGFYYNNFFSIEEKTLAWDNLSNIKVDLSMDSRNRGVNLEYYLIFNNGESFFLDTGAPNLIGLNNFLKSIGIQTINGSIMQEAINEIETNPQKYPTEEIKSILEIS